MLRLMLSALACTLLAFASPGAAQQGPPPGQQGFPPGGFQQGRRRTQTQEQPAAQAETGTPAAAITLETSVTHHTIDLPTGTLRYTATAGQIPLRNEDGEVECRMFYVAYTKDDADPHTRPVTFAFNGGPGSATLWLHMGALGPMRAPMTDDGSLPKPPYKPIPNMDTWLDFTDVVVIDAPGTGYSRLSSPSLATKYFGVQQDVQAFTDFVRNWITDDHRWDSPMFVAGESYGGIRGSGLCPSLFQEGIAVSGFISISGTSDFLTLDGMRGNDLPYIGYFPSMADCAWYHHKLGPQFKSVEQVEQEAQKWTDDEYAPALEKGDSLTAAEKDHIAAKMSEFLGVSKEYALGSNLRISAFAFFRECMRKEGLTIGRYDGRLTGREETRIGDRGSGDPTDDATTAPFTSSINEYLENDLGIHTSMTYLNEGNVRPWQEPEGSYAETATQLRNLIDRNPYFHVLYCCGYYDLACPLNATIYTVNHMGLDPEAQKQISFQFFPAGHMMYIEKSSRHKLHDNVRDFEAACLAK